MAQMSKNKQKIAIILVCVFLGITLVTGMVAVFGQNYLPTAGNVSGQDSEEDNPVSEPESQIPDNGAVSDTPDSEEEDNTLPSFSRPVDMKAVYLVPGVDFMTGSSNSAESVKNEIDALLAQAKEYTLNTVVVGLTYNDDSVIYQSSTLPQAVAGLDVLEYIVQQCRDQGLFVYALYDVLSSYEEGAIQTMQQVNSDKLTTIKKDAASFVETYKVDGVILDNYSIEDSSSAYGHYMQMSSGAGYDRFMLEMTQSAINAAAQGVRSVDRNIQVGVLTSSVWANDTDNEAGSATSASYQMLTSANADVKAYIENKLVDFVFVEAFGSTTDPEIPFETVVKWWADLANQNNIPMYAVMAASKAVTNNRGWTSPDQLTKQATILRDVTGCQGLALDSMASLMEDPQGSTEVLVNYFNNKVSEDLILKELTLTKPSQTTYTTSEPSVVFTGASDPNFDLTFNGEVIETDDSGYFNIEVDLEKGLNTFTFSHKDKTITYNITREIIVLKDVSPLGTAVLEGGMKMEITATAYKGSTVYATLNGTKVTMSPAEVDDDDTDRDSTYQKYVGTYTAPAATDSVQSLGNVSVTATYDGYTDTLQGALVKINKKPDLGDGKAVMVTVDSAETFPSDIINDLASPYCYPLPKGTVDTVVGDILTYSEGGTTYSYYILSCGLRVYANNVTNVDSSNIKGNNVISGLKVTGEDFYTYVSLNMSWKAPYDVTITSNGFQIAFAHTTQVPDNLTLTQNSLFSSATWSGSTLTLTFRKTNGFLGYKAYYDSNGYLTFRFTNPAPVQSSGSGYTLNGARIMLDPGHGGNDPGALGNNPNYPEAVINRMIASLVKTKLENMGATVSMIDTTGTMPSLAQRVEAGKSFAPHLFLSIHQNSYVSSGPTGTESYYFYSYQKVIASSLTSAISSTANWNNRGAKYNAFYVTRDSELPATLLEVGFVSTPSEYQKLIDSSYQNALANGIVNGIVNYFIATGSLNSQPTGVQSVGDMEGTVTPPPSSSSQDPSSSQPSSSSSSSLPPSSSSSSSQPESSSSQASSESSQESTSSQVSDSIASSQSTDSTGSQSTASLPEDTTSQSSVPDNQASHQASGS